MPLAHTVGPYRRVGIVNQPVESDIDPIPVGRPFRRGCPHRLNLHNGQISPVDGIFVPQSPQIICCGETVILLTIVLKLHDRSKTITFDNTFCQQITCLRGIYRVIEILIVGILQHFRSPVAAAGLAHKQLPVVDQQPVL